MLKLMYDFGFAIEQLLGHVTHSKHLKQWVSQDSSIRPVWLPIEASKNDIWERVPVVRTNWSLKSSLRARDEIRETLRHQSLDALFLHTQSLALFAVPLMQRIPTIISTDATPLNYDRVGAGYGHKASSSFIERQKFLWTCQTYQAAAALVTWCNWAKESLIADYGITADKVSVIPPGIDLEQWRIKSKTTLEKDTSPSPVRLLFVGGDFVRKGGSILMEAFHGGLRQECILDIVTKDRKIERDLADVEGVRVHCGLTSSSPLLKELYAKADVFVFPTQADCLPIAVIEAMAAGLPVVTTDVGALSEEVENGVNGFLVPPGDAQALLAAVQTLVRDESRRCTMAIASRRLAEERFDHRRNYNQILSLMKCLTEQRMVSNRLPSQNFLLPRL
jgi:glycosyltransferase involved in cell wall biosynthesis